MTLHSIVTYGPGGFDRSKPNNNVIDVEHVELSERFPAAAEDRIAALETELEALRSRVSGVPALSSEVKAMRDAIVGNQP